MRLNFIMRFSGLVLVAVVVAIAGFGCDSGDEAEGFVEISPGRDDLPAPKMLDDGSYVAPKIPPGGYPTYAWDGEIPTKLMSPPSRRSSSRRGRFFPSRNVSPSRKMFL